MSRNKKKSGAGRAKRPGTKVKLALGIVTAANLLLELALAVQRRKEVRRAVELVLTGDQPEKQNTQNTGIK